MGRSALSHLKAALICLLLLVTTPAAWAGGVLSDNIRIDSKILGYALQYRVYRPEGVAAKAPLPTVYVTDGQWYLKDGGFKETLDRMIASHVITPVMAVFVDARNPDKPAENRRNDQFMCNQAYANFFAGELVPTVEAHFAALANRDHRLIMGLSFGGLNAGCFGLMVPSVFGKIAMQSPASDKHVKLLMGLYKNNPVQLVRMFLSVGKKKDNTSAVRRFHKLLVKKGYDVTYKEVPYGHEWANWRPLIDDVLTTFYGTAKTG
ncbi:alpha/beta hydrolase [Kordiimonas marina]|uniref:alpha/beta hydrolase n=1 Tax=Kordiimonas marina TaxID=2872312 RepID=UPI001FF4EC73|nr:alpha/beta hydrolase-fold protein [Kordiimonas marina]MCJ9428081.1 hypothetical protein [Kordiimonas marina]